MSRIAPGTFPSLHVLVRDAELARPEFARTAAGLRRACGAALALHLRAPETSARRQLETASGLAREAERLGGWCVVNERLDVALAAGAQAVQLGEAGLPVAEARRLAPAAMRIGASVHDAARARDARDAGANYLVAGTIHRSGTHPERAPAGHALLAACAALGIPVVAIGGMDAERVEPAVRAGAAGVAVIRAVWEVRDPVAAALRLLEALERAGAATTRGGPCSDGSDEGGTAPPGERSAEEGAGG